MYRTSRILAEPFPSMTATTNRGLAASAPAAPAASTARANASRRFCAENMACIADSESAY
jgi:hypothetical protein